MKRTIGLAQFRDGSQIRKESFSYEGLGALFNYLEECEEDGCGEIEYDPIGLCCEYTEYENIAEFHENYGETGYETLDKISDHTTVIPLKVDSFIIQDF